MINYLEADQSYMTPAGVEKEVNRKLNVQKIGIEVEFLTPLGLKAGDVIKSKPKRYPFLSANSTVLPMRH